MRVTQGYVQADIAQTPAQRALRITHTIYRGIHRDLTNATLACTL
jgi:hypothetical protein